MSNNNESVKFDHINPNIANDIRNLYGVEKLGNYPNFQGNFINFGYWKNILREKNQKITVEQRIESSKALYHLVFDELNLNEKDVVVELGCGRGVGCIELVRSKLIKKLVGLDLTAEHIQLAEENAAKMQKYLKLIPLFKIASADNTGLVDGEFSKAYSVEAAQYFPSFENFAAEMFRILKKKGMLVITTFFLTSADAYSKVKQIIPSVNDLVDTPIPINFAINALVKQGFKIAKNYSIGHEVFAGYDEWLRICNTPTEWSHTFHECFVKGLLDYRLIVCIKE